MTAKGDAKKPNVTNWLADSTFSHSQKTYEGMSGRYNFFVASTLLVAWT